MDTLKQVQKSRNPSSPKAYGFTKTEDDLIDLFPQPRYFQVHFQHIHENAHDLQDKLVQLKDYVAKVDEKIDRVLALLGRSSVHIL
jgi:hypothetical protein